MKNSGEKKNILYVLHEDFYKAATNSIGGTQLHVQNLTASMVEIYNVFVLARSDDFLNVSIYQDTDERTLLQVPLNPSYTQEMIHDPGHEKAYEHIFSLFNIDMIHIHHTMHLTLDIYEVANRFAIPIIVSLHDFFYICPTFTMLDSDDRLCLYCDNDIKCKACLAKRLKINNGVHYMNKWRHKVAHVLQYCQWIIVPSKSAAHTLVKYYPNIKDKLKIIPHGIQPITNELNTAALERKPIIKSKKMVAVLDTCKVQSTDTLELFGYAYLTDVSGIHITSLVKVTDKNHRELLYPVSMVTRNDIPAYDSLCGIHCTVPLNKMASGPLEVQLLIWYKSQLLTTGEVRKVGFQKNNDISFRVAFLGGTGIHKGSRQAMEIVTQNPKGVGFYFIGGLNDQKLIDFSSNNSIKTGTYSQALLPLLLKAYEIDLICILSLSPETFCYTLSEAVICQLPTIVTNRGALPERVATLDCGWVVDADNAVTETVALVEQLKSKDSEYQKIVAHLETLKLRTVSEMVADYISLYATILPEGGGHKPYSLKQLQMAGQIFSQQDHGMSVKLRESKQALWDVQHSLEYRIAKKFKIPFRNQIKRLYYFLLQKK